MTKKATLVYIVLSPWDRESRIEGGGRGAGTCRWRRVPGGRRVGARLPRWCREGRGLLRRRSCRCGARQRAVGNSKTTREAHRIKIRAHGQKRKEGRGGRERRGGGGHEIINKGEAVEVGLAAIVSGMVDWYHVRWQTGCQENKEERDSKSVCKAWKGLHGLLHKYSGFTVAVEKLS